MMYCIRENDSSPVKSLATSGRSSREKKHGNNTYRQTRWRMARQRRMCGKAGESGEIQKGVTTAIWSALYWPHVFSEQSQSRVDPVIIIIITIIIVDGGFEQQQQLPRSSYKRPRQQIRAAVRVDLEKLITVATEFGFLFGYAVTADLSHRDRSKRWKPLRQLVTKHERRRWRRAFRSDRNRTWSWRLCDFKNN